MSKFNGLTSFFLLSGGLKIFPCREGGAAAKAPYTRHGFKEATNNSAIVEVWRSQFPNALWGLPCAMNGVLVLDADRHGNGDGVSNLMRIFDRHQFDWHQVPVVATPRGGYHFYFRRPNGMGRTRGALCEAVDIRDNAYVIAPGCAMADGGRYELVEGGFSLWAEVIFKGTLRPPPAWLLPLLLAPAEPPRKQVHAQLDDEFLRSRMRGIIRVVLDAQEGQRNSTLYWAACRFADLVHDNLVLHEFAQALLEEAGERVGLSACEASATAASGLRKAGEGDRDAR
jgi:hypothetical protein